MIEATPMSRMVTLEPEEAMAVDRWTNEGGRVGDRVDMTIVAPGHRFVDRSMAVDRPPTAAHPRSQRTASTSQGVSRATFSAVEPRNARAT